jgi:hypothetical protein
MAEQQHNSNLRSRLFMSTRAVAEKARNTNGRPLWKKSSPFSESDCDDLGPNKVCHFGLVPRPICMEIAALRSGTFRETYRTFEICLSERFVVSLSVSHFLPSADYKVVRRRPWNHFLPSHPPSPPSPPSPDFIEK